MRSSTTGGPRSILAARIAPRSAPVRKQAALESPAAGRARACWDAQRAARWIQRLFSGSSPFAERLPPAPPRWERRRCWPSLRSEQIGRRLAARRERARKLNLPRAPTWD